MKFWDASAVVPLVVTEDETDHCRRLLDKDVQVVVWFLSVVEVISALTRRRRGITLKPGDFRKAKEQLLFLEKFWSELISVDRVRERAGVF